MVAARLADSSTDVIAAVVLDAAGGLVEVSGVERERARELADLARQLVERADSVSSDPVAQIEVQTVGGAVFAVRDSRHVLACVTRRAALPALVLYDLRRALAELAPA
ncbi:MAG TPA: roadblock/LC7 domain-containing protein [Thermoleophilaceae bacterium]|nr:roadblock/LC7 domain-containing protein [Thermoleophilaceae bacterium]